MNGIVPKKEKVPFQTPDSSASFGESPRKLQLIHSVFVFKNIFLIDAQPVMQDILNSKSSAADF